jgi:hypothetical protein
MICYINIIKRKFIAVNAIQVTPQCSKTQLGYRRIRIVVSTHVVEAANLLALLVASMGCWLERQAVAQIEYLKAENRLLRSRLGRRRLLFSDAERRTLATLAREVAAKALRDLDTLVSPATLLRRHRDLIAQKTDVSRTTQPWQAPH